MVYISSARRYQMIKQYKQGEMRVTILVNTKAFVPINTISQEKRACSQSDARSILEPKLRKR